MKFLRFLIILVLVVTTAVVIIAMVEPNYVTVQRSINVAASRELVFEQIANLKNFTNWDPWHRMDSTAKITYQGQDGQVGSSYRWEGDDKKIGTGEMKDTALSDGHMDYTLHFEKPIKGEATGFFNTSDSGNGQTHVTWSCTMHMGFPWNAMLLFADMDKKLGPDFDSGLHNLKAYVESRLNTWPPAGITETQFPGRTYAGVRKIVNWNEMAAFLAATYPALRKEVETKITGPGTMLVYFWDTTNHKADIAAAFPVADTVNPVKGATFFRIPRATAYMTVLNGAYGGAMKAHNTVTAFVKSKGKENGLVVEEYLVGASQNKDSTTWVTNIYHFMK